MNASQLRDRLQAQLAEVGMLSFAEVMGLALYDPEGGYYGVGPRKIGREGDFFTAVSVGPLYGRLLAHLAEGVAHEMGCGADLVVVEQAAHEGQLAADVLASCDRDYWIVEPNAKYEEAQRTRLAVYAGRVHWVADLAELPALPALYVCNELVDALPLHRVEWTGDAWEELCVCAAEGGELAYALRPAQGELAEAVKGYPTHLEKGFRTEVPLQAMRWMRELAQSRLWGRFYVADYGLDEEEFFQPERREGTVRRYFQHQMDNLVLQQLGECDLTAQVNFSALIGVAESLGLQVRRYEHQGRYLGRLGLPWLTSLEGRRPDSQTAALLRQYHSLTHPGIMGRQFRVLELEKRPC